MKSLFHPDSLRILESLAFTRTLFAFDYDGTLSQIVKRPGLASVTHNTNSLLHELSTLAPVAILSGRSLRDLKERLTFTPKYLIGNHGLEGLETSAESLEIAEKICRKWKRKLGAKLTGRKIGLGVELEDKMYSIAIHYRRSRNKRKTRLHVLEITADLSPPPRILLGKCVINILPSGAPHKGVALMELMQHLEIKSAFYVGDDYTDEDIFALPDSRIFTVRVGAKRTSRAQYFILRQTDVTKVLRLLIDYHRHEKHT
ncbi:MAG TPA: trehalose-phosphatase [Bdellovibrionota bacterium]|nr:trehalose-phosphatase [Bdellovibrionota bacterium]